MKLNRSPRPPSFGDDVLAFLFVYPTKRRRLYELTDARKAARLARAGRLVREFTQLGDLMERAFREILELRERLANLEARRHNAILARRELSRRLGVDDA